MIAPSYDCQRVDLALLVEQAHAALTAIGEPPGRAEQLAASVRGCTTTRRSDLRTLVELAESVAVS